MSTHQVIKAPLTTWKASDVIMATIQELIAKYHPHLALISDEIAVVFNEKAAKSGGVVITGKTAKASKLFGILGDVDYKFVITIGNDAWEEMTHAQQIALLDHHLCSCQAKEKRDGGISYFIQPPDMSFYQQEVERHGFWRTSGGDQVDRDLIEAIFGKDE